MIENSLQTRAILLSIPRNKEQVEVASRLSQVRNQSSRLIPDGQDVVLAVVVKVCVRAYGYVHVGIRQSSRELAPLSLNPVPHT